MDKKRTHFERVGIAYIPCTIAGLFYLFAFVLATLSVVFLVGAVWVGSGLRGVNIVRGLILMTGVIAMVRFAQRRSN